MCLYPKLINNPKYKKTKKNQGIIPAVTDTRVLKVPIGCQKCIECKKQKARNWHVRIMEDIKTNTNGKCVTLTFDTKSLIKLKRKIDHRLQGYDIDNAIATKATRLFLENYRSKHGHSLRHWLITELGHQGTEHLHLHGIIWTDHSIEYIAKQWTYGWTCKGKWNPLTDKYINYVNEETAGYLTKYVHKQDLKHPNYNPVILTTPGIGSNYTNTHNSTLNKFKNKDTNELYRTRTGHQIALPIYYRNKIYSETQREQLWLQKLDKQERYVCGTRVSIKNSDRDYYRLLSFHRQRNQELGYGDDSKNWEQIEYEKQCRTIKIQERINASLRGSNQKGLD